MVTFDQIHFADKRKSSLTIRQFASRPRNNKAETIVWFGTKNISKRAKDYDSEWENFLEQRDEATIGLNKYVQLFPKRIRKSHISTLIQQNSEFCDGWMKNGLRYYNDEIVLDHTKIGNFFYELNVSRESSKFSILEKNLKNYGFHVFYISIEKEQKHESIQKENQKELKKVNASRKKEREQNLKKFSEETFSVVKRRKELLQLSKRTEKENRELQLATKWIGLQKKGKSNVDILMLLKNGSDDRAIKRNAERLKLHTSELREQLSYLIIVNQKYNAEERSDLLIEAERNMKSNKSNQLNINRLADGTINGKTSKRIFSDLFKIRSHVYCGKHSISVTEL